MSISCPSDDRDAEDRAAYEVSRNPFYLSMAVCRYSLHEPLPYWVRRALRDAHAGALRAASPETCPFPPAQALQYVLRAFGFVRPGWNAIKAYRQDREDGFVATVYGLTAKKGQAEAAAVDLGNPRRVRRRVAKIRRMRAKVSQPTP